jgi:hypothetical protein
MKNVFDSVIKAQIILERRMTFGGEYFSAS